jgi:CheY-like chemotaxis protein
MLINLLGNAIKHTEKGSVTLRMDAQGAGDAGRVWLSFDVEDTGIGIALEDQERIFEPFVQVGPNSQKGTGLGLAITRQFAILLGGSIRVTSAPGVGSRFRLELPVKLANSFVEESGDVEGDYFLATGQPDYRILVVDDEPENRLLLQRLLQTAGFEVRVAEDGVQAIGIFQNWLPHFIWMDLRMPDIDGAGTARRIRALDGGRKVTIVAVTASEKTHSPAGMDDVVHKPYKPPEIFDCMARHLGVTYRIDEKVETPSGPAAALESAALAALPDELRMQLTNAVVTLDNARIAAVIHRITELDAVLGSALTYHADRFAFTRIWEALRECKSTMPAT